MLWQKLERTRRLLGGQCKRYCIRNVLKSWFGFEANDDFIWRVCHLCEQEGWNELPEPLLFPLSIVNCCGLSWPSKRASAIGELI